jgi:glycosyltransferase involved in cell wall biosynthesis
MMDGAASYRPRVPPVPPEVARPLWSVMIPTFNCAGYLGETLRSVFAQDPGSDVMQIEVIDDHSTDDPETVVQKLGNGRARFYRQPKKVGITQNFYTCIARSRGRLVHLLHGDDRVLDGFYARMQEAFANRPQIGAAFCRHFFIDSKGETLSTSALEQPRSGILDNWLERLAEEQRIMTPSIVVRREAYEALGTFDSRLVCAEDWEMWVRIAARYPVWYEPEPLASYRMHQSSNTGRHVHTAEDIRYTRLAIDMFKSYLPTDRAASITRRARTVYALSAIGNARSLWRGQDRTGAVAQLREALKLSRSVKVITALARFIVRDLIVPAHRAEQRHSSGKS